MNLFGIDELIAKALGPVIEWLQKIYGAGVYIVNTTGKFFFAAGGMLLTLVIFLSDIAQKITHLLAARGTLGAYAATVIDPTVTNLDIKFPQVQSMLGQIGLNWMAYAHKWIPMELLWQSMVALFAIFIYAAILRTVKAWIPGLN